MFETDDGHFLHVSSQYFDVPNVKRWHIIFKQFWKWYMFIDTYKSQVSFINSFYAPIIIAIMRYPI